MSEGELPEYKKLDRGKIINDLEEKLCIKATIATQDQIHLQKDELLLILDVKVDENFKMN